MLQMTCFSMIGTATCSTAFVRHTLTQAMCGLACAGLQPEAAEDETLSIGQIQQCLDLSGSTARLSAALTAGTALLASLVQAGTHLTRVLAVDARQSLPDMPFGMACHFSAGEHAWLPEFAIRFSLA